MKPEQTLKKAIVDAMRMFGAAVWDTEQNRRDTRVTAGLPDLFVIYKDRYTWAELKAPRTKLDWSQPERMLRDSQRAFKIECHNSGCPWALWVCVDDALTWMGIKERAL